MVYCNLMDQKAAADDLKEALGMHHQRRAALLAELDRWVPCRGVRLASDLFTVGITE